MFTRAAGATNLADVYLAANTVPNILFEIVAGGALAALVVPLVAGHIAGGDRGATGRTAGALLCWALLVLTPLAVLLAALARPIMWLLMDDPTPPELATGTHMLMVFAPQLPLYGIGIVLTGVLQAHRRFAWPVLAPLLSSLTVISAYTLFALAEPSNVGIPGVSRGGELILSVGTTLAVAVLTLCLVIPVRALGLAWRPGLRFEPGAARRVRGLAGIGVLTVVAQQLSLLVAIKLVLWGTWDGSLLLFNQAQTMYLLPWAVLAVPLATSAYPALADAHARGDRPRYAHTLAGAGRGVLLLCGLGAGALVAVAAPAAHALAAIARQVPAAQVGTLAATIIAFAPGLLGYGAFALLLPGALRPRRQPGRRPRHAGRLGRRHGAVRAGRAGPAGRRPGTGGGRRQLRRHAGPRRRAGGAGPGQGWRGGGGRARPGRPGVAGCGYRGRGGRPGGPGTAGQHPGLRREPAAGHAVCSRGGAGLRRGGRRPGAGPAPPAAAAGTARWRREGGPMSRRVALVLGSSTGGVGYPRRRGSPPAWSRPATRSPSTARRPPRRCSTSPAPAPPSWPWRSRPARSLQDAAAVATLRRALRAQPPLTSSTPTGYAPAWSPAWPGRAPYHWSSPGTTPCSPRVCGAARWPCWSAGWPAAPR